ncbi:unnamed protein product [Prunus armeniaca]
MRSPTGEGHFLRINCALFRSEERDHSWKWHRRFGHLNYVGLKMLQDKEMVLGLPTLENFGDVCEGCTTSKAHKEAFDKNEV